MGERWRKWNQIQDENHLAYVLTHVSNILFGQLFTDHLDKYGKRTTDFGKSPLEHLQEYILLVSYPPPHSWKSDLHNWPIPVLWCFQEILEIGLKSKCKKGSTSIRSKSSVSCLFSHVFTSVITQLHLFVSQCCFCIFYINQQLCSITADRNHLFTLQHFYSLKLIIKVKRTHGVT